MPSMTHDVQYEKRNAWKLSMNFQAPCADAFCLVYYSRRIEPDTCPKSQRIPPALPTLLSAWFKNSTVTTIVGRTVLAFGVQCQAHDFNQRVHKVPFLSDVNIYLNLPQRFTTAEGIGIAESYGMKEHAFKMFLKTPHRNIIQKRESWRIQ